MTERHDEYGEIIRRALQAEADAVVPSGDGLEQIRARIDDRPPRLGWAWFSATWARPLLVVAATVMVAAIAVSAPPAIDSISPTQGGRFDGGGQVPGDIPGSDQAGAQGTASPFQPGQPAVPPPGVTVPPSPLPSVFVSCVPPPDPRTSPRPATSPTETNTPGPAGTELPVCDAPVPTTQPTPVETTPPPPDPSSEPTLPEAQSTRESQAEPGTAGAGGGTSAGQAE